MIDVGKTVRYVRIVNAGTGKTVMVPLDHGVIQGPVPGIEDPAATVREVVSGGADAVIFNAGLARSIWREYANRCGSVFNLTNIVTAENDLTLISTVEVAMRNGADAVSVQVMIGSPHELHMLENVRTVVDRCERWGLPVLAMIYPTEELLARQGHGAELLAARAGAELGADIVKTSYTGDVETFRPLVEGLSCSARGGGRAAQGDGARGPGDGGRGDGVRGRGGRPRAQRMAERRPRGNDRGPGSHRPSGQKRQRPRLS